MNDPVAEIEARARESGVTVADALKAAGVNGSTWRRWKGAKNSPTFSKLRKIHDAIERLKAAH